MRRVEKEAYRLISTFCRLRCLSFCLSGYYVVLKRRDWGSGKQLYEMRCLVGKGRPFERLPT